MRQPVAFIFIFFFLSSVIQVVPAADPYSARGSAMMLTLEDDDPLARARAAEALGYIRYYPAESSLLAALADDEARVRREAALALAWCGGRLALPSLLDSMGDPDWTVRQSAWVALTNITGMEFAFDSLASEDERSAQKGIWRLWLADLPQGGLPAELIAMLGSDCHRDVERAARAAGALGADAGTVALLARAIEPWSTHEDEPNQEAKWRVQAALRALGRSGEAAALPVLTTFLAHPQWVRYAAEALGDYGGPEAASALIDAFPRQARAIGPQIVQESTHRGPATHASDTPRLDSRDRILAAPYAIALALSRIINETPPATHKDLRDVAPLIAAQTPLDIDGLLVYEEEPYQPVFRHLLEASGLRRALVEEAFAAIAGSPTPPAPAEIPDWHDLRSTLDPARSPFASNIILTFCRDKEDVPRLIQLLGHSDHWVRINAARTLLFMDARESANAIGELLEASQPEAAFGVFTGGYFSRAQGQDEFNDPAPRFREAFVMALGGLDARGHVPLLGRILNDDRNALGIQHRAALALDQIGTADAITTLRAAELDHPYHSVRMVAREALWRRGLPPNPRPGPPPVPPPRVAVDDIPEKATRFVFIKGDLIPYNPFQMDSWRQAYMTTDSGPTYRPGRNLYILDITSGVPVVTPLTRFSDGHVADCSVSYDGQTVWFSRRRGDSPWWHLFRIDADGSNLRQVTDGPYHDIQPVEMPSGRIAFSTSRLGTRDEYHGYLCTGLATMAPDGEDIQVIGFNFGRDAEPTVAEDGRLLFTRIELFYSRMKTEANLLACSPDGTRMQTLYGPERREMWSHVHGGYANWARDGLRHRQLRLTQPQTYLPGQYLLTTPAGPIITRGRLGEIFIRKDSLRPGGNDPWVITTPWTLDENTLLVAAGRKNHEIVRAEFPKDAVDLGIHTLCVETGNLELLYNDPESADFEARPLHPRAVPPALAESPTARQGEFTGTLFVQSAFFSQEPHMQGRGRLIRVVEGLPQVTRHATHTTPNENAWKNHGGAFGRDLATLPLAADGSFAARVPADRFLHLQVLDSDRNVVGNQLVWMNVRPGETRGCVGCHEPPDTAPPPPGNGSAFAHAMALHGGTLPEALPDGPDHMRYRAKIWFKGHVPQEREERQRTVQSTSYFGR